MDKPRRSSDGRDVMHTAPLPPRILHDATALTHATPDSASRVPEFSRTTHRSCQSHGRGNKPAFNIAVPRTSGLQRHTYQPQAAAWQQQPPAIDNSARLSNIDNRQRDVNGVHHNAVAVRPPVVHHGRLGES